MWHAAYGAWFCDVIELYHNSMLVQVKIMIAAYIKYKTADNDLLIYRMNHDDIMSLTIIATLSVIFYPCCVHACYTVVRTMHYNQYNIIHAAYFVSI